MTVWSKTLPFPPCVLPVFFLHTHKCTYTMRSKEGGKQNELPFYVFIKMDFPLYILYLCAHNVRHSYKRRLCIAHGSRVNGPCTLKLSSPLCTAILTHCSSLYGFINDKILNRNQLYEIYHCLKCPAWCLDCWNCIFKI